MQWCNQSSSHMQVISNAHMYSYGSLIPQEIKNYIITKCNGILNRGTVIIGSSHNTVVVERENHIEERN